MLEADPAMSKTGSASMKLKFRRLVKDKGNTHRAGHTLIKGRGISTGCEGRGEAPERLPSSSSYHSPHDMPIDRETAVGQGLR